YCNQARRYFNTHGVAYSEYDVEQDAAAGREFKRLGGHGVPLILVGEARLQGFSEGGFEQLYNQ
uniref:glutaredoxin family protein n=1 Tax=uncultured Lamprocystis sp. TaxID=543132 RepID=UPI0025D1CEFA